MAKWGIGPSLVVAAGLLFSTGCRKDPGTELSAVADEFVHTTLGFSPISATQAGLHELGGVRLDEQLDDYSAAALERQRRFYIKVRERLGTFRPAELKPGERADLTILQDQVELALLDLNEVQSAAHNPTLYVESLGTALFAPYTLEYAPQAERLRHILARLQRVPLFLDQARSNLVFGSRAVDSGGAGREPGQHRPGGQDPAGLGAGEPARRLRACRPSGAGRHERLPVISGDHHAIARGGRLAPGHALSAQVPLRPGIGRGGRHHAAAGRARTGAGARAHAGTGAAHSPPHRAPARRPRRYRRHRPRKPGDRRSAGAHRATPLHAGRLSRRRPPGSG